MVGSCAERSDLQSGFLVPADVTVNDDAAHLVVDVVNRKLLDNSKRLPLEGNVLGALPVHRFFGFGILNHSLLLLVTYFIETAIRT